MINKLLNKIRKDRIFETDDAKDIFDHFYQKADRKPASYSPPLEQLQNLYDQFSEIEAQLDQTTVDNLELTAEFKNGTLIDYSSQSTSLTNEIKHNILKQNEGFPIIESFHRMISECIASDKDYTIKVFGKNKTGIEGWHTDGKDEVVGILTLKNHEITTLFNKSGKIFEAPANSIAFTGNATHRNPNFPRPTIHIIAHNAPTAAAE